MSRILHHRRLLIAGAVAAALLVSAAVVARLPSTGSSGSSASGSSMAALPAGSALQGNAPTPGGDSSISTANGSTGGEGAVPAPSSQIASDVSPLDARRFLVRTGEMSLTVGKGGVPQAAARVVGLTTGYGGYVLTSQVSTADSSSPPFADITVRVPATSYDVAIQRFGALGRVQAVQTSADDVTSQYVDLRARLAQARRVDQRLLGFLGRATTVTEALAVQARIDATELRVEQLTGQLKALREQVYLRHPGGLDHPARRAPRHEPQGWFSRSPGGVVAPPRRAGSRRSSWAWARSFRTPCSSPPWRSPPGSAPAPQSVCASACASSSSVTALAPPFAAGAGAPSLRAPPAPRCAARAASA